MSSAKYSRSWRILGREEQETWRRPDSLLRLGYQKLAVVIQEAVERLQHLRWCEVELVQDDPVTSAKCLNKNAVLPLQLPSLSDTARREAPPTTRHQEP